MSCHLTLVIVGVGRDGLDQHQGSRVALAAVLGEDRRRPSEGYGVACRQYIQVKWISQENTNRLHLLHVFFLNICFSPCLPFQFASTDKNNNLVEMKKYQFSCVKGDVMFVEPHAIGIGRGMAMQ